MLKACKLDIAKLASEEEGSNDVDFIPEAIPQPNSDDSSSSTKSEEPAPVKAPSKCARAVKYIISVAVYAAVVSLFILYL